VAEVLEHHFLQAQVAELADAFGWNGHIVENSKDLVSTLESAFEESGPSLIVIPIDYRENMKLTERLGDIACPI